MLRDRRRALREAREGGLWMSSTRVAADSNTLIDYEEEDWFTDEEEEEEGAGARGGVDSALLRESRLREMKQLPVCFDQEMAERYKIIKQESTHNTQRHNSYLLILTTFGPASRLNGTVD